MNQQNKTERITFRTTKKGRSQIEAAAKRNDTSVSAYIEDCLLSPTVRSREQAGKFSNALIQLLNLTNRDFDTVSQMRKSVEHEVLALCQELI